jgi:hypothetical protein
MSLALSYASVETFYALIGFDAMLLVQLSIPRIGAGGSREYATEKALLNVVQI